jgi:hypothetical protein
MENKQTAVEWLESNLPTAFKDLTINKQLIEQAKEMEKEQHGNTWYTGNEDKTIHEFEYYWEETYGGNK